MSSRKHEVSAPVQTLLNPAERSPKLSAMGLGPGVRKKIHPALASRGTKAASPRPESQRRTAAWRRWHFSVTLTGENQRVRRARRRVENKLQFIPGWYRVTGSQNANNIWRLWLPLQDTTKLPFSSSLEPCSFNTSCPRNVGLNELPNSRRRKQDRQEEGRAAKESAVRGFEHPARRHACARSLARAPAPPVALETAPRTRARTAFPRSFFR